MAVWYLSSLLTFPSFSPPLSSWPVDNYFGVIMLTFSSIFNMEIGEQSGSHLATLRMLYLAPTIIGGRQRGEGYWQWDKFSLSILALSWKCQLFVHLEIKMSIHTFIVVMTVAMTFNHNEQCILDIWACSMHAFQMLHLGTWAFHQLKWPPTPKGFWLARFHCISRPKHPVIVSVSVL